MQAIQWTTEMVVVTTVIGLALAPEAMTEEDGAVTKSITEFNEETI